MSDSNPTKISLDVVSHAETSTLDPGPEATDAGAESLWECLHDGSLVSIESDAMERTVAFIVDSSFHREFHLLSAETMFEIVGQNVRIVEVFDFEPWAGALEPPRETPWNKADETRRQNYAKGRLVSADWMAFVAGIATDEQFIILEAEVRLGKPLAVLELGVMSFPHSNYRTVMIHAESFRFQVGERVLSLTDFQEFGAAYWNHWAERSKAKSIDVDPT